MILLDGSISPSTTCSPSPTTAPRSGSRRRRARASPRRAPSSTPRPTATTPVYGINTGFGTFAETRIDKHDLAALQLNLLRSHAAGVDEPLPVRAVRAAMALRANVLAKGYLRHPRRDARGAARAAQPRRASARAEPRIGRRQRRPRAARAPRAGPHRRRRDAVDGRRRGVPGAEALRERRARADRARARRKAWRSSTARRPRPRCSRWRSPAPSGWRRAADIARGAVDRRAAWARCIRSSRASTRARPFAGTGGVGRQPAPLLEGSAHQRVARQLRPRAGRLLDALRAAGARRGARSAHLDPSHRRRSR